MAAKAHCPCLQDHGGATHGWARPVGRRHGSRCSILRCRWPIRWAGSSAVRPDVAPHRSSSLSGWLVRAIASKARRRSRRRWSQRPRSRTAASEGLGKEWRLVRNELRLSAGWGGRIRTDIHTLSKVLILYGNIWDSVTKGTPVGYSQQANFIIHSTGIDQGPIVSFAGPRSRANDRGCGLTGRAVYGRCDWVSSRLNEVAQRRLPTSAKHLELSMWAAALAETRHSYLTNQLVGLAPQLTPFKTAFARPESCRALTQLKHQSLGTFFLAGPKHRQRLSACELLHIRPLHRLPPSSMPFIERHLMFMNEGVYSAQKKIFITGNLIFLFH